MVVWWGMLIAMLACWGAQGRPIYSFMDGKHMRPVFLSDIAATNLNPLFISCVGFQMIFFIGSLVMEYVLRKQHKLQPYVSKKQPIFAILSIVSAILAQIGILLVSIFKTSIHEKVHLSMLGVFIFFLFWACFFNFFNSFIFGNFPQRLHPNHERVIFGTHKWQNLYMVSFIAKLVWLTIAVIFAIAFGTIADDSTSAIFEWMLCFWYGFLLLFWSIDLFPLAVKNYRVRHPEKFEENFVDNHKLSPSVSEGTSETDNEYTLRNAVSLEQQVWLWGKKMNDKWPSGIYMYIRINKIDRIDVLVLNSRCCVLIEINLR